MPKDSDLQIFSNFKSTELARLMDPYHHWTASDFITLRDLLVARLTVFNARRGGEPCHLLQCEWRDADQGAWLDKTITDTIKDPLERYLIENDKIAYQAGKGNNHLVSVLIPNDVVPGLSE